MHRLRFGGLATLLGMLVALAPATMPSVLAHPGYAGPATTLEALPLTHAVGVSVLSPASPGHFTGFDIDHGLQLTAQNATPGSALEVHLGGLYTSVVGTIYGDTASACNAVVTLQDVTNPASGVKQLFQATVNPSAQATFNIDLHGVQDITIDNQRQYNCGGSNPEMVDIVSSLTPTPVTGVSPAANAVIPRATPITFRWKRSAGASIYMLSISLVKQSTNKALTPASKVTVTKLVFSGTTSTWNPAGFLPGIYQYTILPLDRYGAALASGSLAVQFTLAQ